MVNNHHTLIIAEVGVNHNGDIKIAKRLIEAAADAGANLVKFQTFSADALVTQNAPKANYQNQITDQSESQFSMLKRLELNKYMHQVLVAYCKEQNIGFFSSGFDIQSLEFLVSIGTELFKIPSGEITNLPYLRYVGEFGKSVILSSGMATLSEIEAALEVLEAAGTPRAQITVLHCNTEYPTPMVDVNLRAMLTINKSLGVEVGYSDHTAGIEVPIAAVAMGATVIEKHLTIDRKLPGPDHKASLEPDEFTAMVRAIRNIEQAMGDGVKVPSPSEAKNMSNVRKSLVAAKPISKGERFNAENVTSKRPGTGISPMRWDEVIGRVSTRDFTTNELISL